jgi:nucleoside-diphosphate-sugar epimerase
VTEISGRKVLVTGATGFIGSRLCGHLAAKGAVVHGTFRTKDSVRDNSVAWHQVRLEEIEDVRNLLASVKPDYIFHLASHVVGARHLEVVLPTFQSNLLTTVNLLTGAAEMGCRRIVLAGSLEEPEPGSADAPSSPYAAAKWSSNAYARMFHALYQTPVVVARIFMVYGPAQRDLKKLIPYVTLSLSRGEAPELTSGQREVDWIYVDDVVEGLLALALAPEADGCTIDLGSGQMVSVRKVVEILAQQIDSGVEPVFGAVSERPMEQVRVAKTAETYKKTGWKPKTSLEQGLRHTIQWYRERMNSSQGPDSLRQ